MAKQLQNTEPITDSLAAKCIAIYNRLCPTTEGIGALILLSNLAVACQVDITEDLDEQVTAILKANGIAPEDFDDL